MQGLSVIIQADDNERNQKHRGICSSAETQMPDTNKLDVWSSASKSKEVRGLDKYGLSVAILVQNARTCRAQAW